MITNNYCTQRIKPKLLREQKTEALLVFIRTTLDPLFQKSETIKVHSKIGTDEDVKYIDESITFLYNNLLKTVVNSTYLQKLIASSGKSQSLSILAKQEKPLMVYYDSLVKGIESNLESGTNWIPEVMVFALLSQWILEEEKSAYYYPYLKDIDYIDLLSRYENSKKLLNDDQKKTIMEMYQLSTILIEKLKTSSYKITISKAKKKKRKK